MVCCSAIVFRETFRVADSILHVCLSTWCVCAVDKLHAAEQIRQRAQEKARLSAQQEAAELAIAVAEAKSRILEQSSHEDDDEPVGSRRMGSTL